MELSEVFTSPFSTATTCYCGSPNYGISSSGENQDTSFRFATENHILGISFHEDGTVRTLDHGNVPRDNSSVICIGYSQRQHRNDRGLSDSRSGPEGEPIQAMALIDPMYIDQPEHGPPNLYQPYQGIDGKEDGASVISSAQSMQDSSVISSNQRAVRRPSTSQAVTATTSSSPSNSLMARNTSNTQLSDAGKAGSSRNLADLESSQSGNTTIATKVAHKTSTMAGLENPQPPTKARLILRIPDSDVSFDRGSTSDTDDDTSSASDYVARLDYRPLSPCIAHWRKGGPINTEKSGEKAISGSSQPLAYLSSTSQSVLGVFVGSADDSRLRFYEPLQQRADDGTMQRKLVARGDLPEAYFRFDTPVMGLKFHSDGTIHTLAVTCQDGTIQLISWTGGHQAIADANDAAVDSQQENLSRQDSLFQHLSMHQVIVDGPLVSLQLLEHPKDGSLRVLVGSLCGYVCQLMRPSSSSIQSSSPTWEGPYMIVQGLWYPSIHAEDSVLAVHAFGDCIALGTLSGRCMIYQMGLYGNRYYKVWECTLPYCIHGFGSVMESSRFHLIVLTRRSLHVFRADNENILITLPPQKYSIELAKQRVAKILLTLEAKQGVNDNRNVRTSSSTQEAGTQNNGSTFDNGNSAPVESDGANLESTTPTSGSHGGECFNEEFSKRQEDLETGAAGVDGNIATSPPEDTDSTKDGGKSEDEQP